MTNLEGHLLIATPEMQDNYFYRGIIFLCEHSDQGAMGLMINAPTDLSVMELIAKMDFLIAGSRHYGKDQLVLSGGPVSTERGFILHTPISTPLLHTYPIGSTLQLTTSGDILDVLGTPQSPEKFIVCLGCCTWKGEQLEQEIAENQWISVPATTELLFETGYLDRWSEANALLGIEGVLAKAGRA
ncbi:hypothetical protein A4G19_08770 [Pasteurellaceae bacterium Macca]|nr:hypothetical protein [Pasteurellaceae bacterium Macca]